MQRTKWLVKKVNHSTTIYHYLKFELVEEVKFELVEEANHSATNLRSPHAALMMACSPVLTSTTLQCQPNGSTQNQCQSLSVPLAQICEWHILVSRFRYAKGYHRRHIFNLDS
jgi:hypothetical protein